MACDTMSLDISSAFKQSTKTPRVRARGVFYSVLAGWLSPQAGYRLLSLSSHLQI